MNDLLALERVAKTWPRDAELWAMLADAAAEEGAPESVLVELRRAHQYTKNLRILAPFAQEQAVDVLGKWLDQQWGEGRI